jgi:hypothetical protein
MRKKDKQPANPRWARGVQTQSYNGLASMICKTDAAIPARSGDVAGIADDVKVLDAGTDGTMRETGNTITVLNMFGSEVASGAYITVKRVRSQWWVDAEDCS